MDVEKEIELLRQRHHKLDVEIEEENTRPAPDGLKISALRKEKLRIKDKIVLLRDTTVGADSIIKRR